MQKPGEGTYLWNLGDMLPLLSQPWAGNPGYGQGDTMQGCGWEHWPRDQTAGVKSQLCFKSRVTSGKFLTLCGPQFPQLPREGDRGVRLAGRLWAGNRTGARRRGRGQQAGLPPAWRGRPTCLLAQVLLQRGQLHVIRVAHGGDVLLQPGPGLLLRLVVGPQPGQALLILLDRRAGNRGERSITASKPGFRESSSVQQSRKRSWAQGTELRLSPW